jgi:hypothetical protein
VPAIGLTSPFGEADRLGDEVRTSATIRAPSSLVQDARLIKVVGLPEPAIQAGRSSAVTLSARWERCLAPISAADLLSRALARTTDSQASGFRASDRPGFSHASDRVGAQPSSQCCPVRRSVTISGCRALGSQAVGAASASCYRITSPEGIVGVPSRGQCGRCQPATTRVIRIADAPCRLLLVLSASRDRPQVPGSACSALHQEHDFADPGRLPPASPTASARLSPSIDCGPPLCPSAGHREVSFRHVFTPQPDEALDPTAYRLFTGAEGPHAACQLLQQSIPRARQRTVRSPAG